MKYNSLLVKTGKTKLLTPKVPPKPRFRKAKVGRAKKRALYNKRFSSGKRGQGLRSTDDFYLSAAKAGLFYGKQRYMQGGNLGLD